MTSPLRSAAEAGEIRTDEDPQDVAERLPALVDGLSVHRLPYPSRVTAERPEQRLVPRKIERLRG